MMTIAEYKRILDKVKPYALVTSLYNHREPQPSPFLTNPSDDF